jgi:hypothetical protein
MAKEKKAPKQSHNNMTQKKPGWNVYEPVSIPDKFPANRVSLNPSNFERLINQHGMRCLIYRSFFCPNVKSVDGAEHEIDCQVPGCNGSGIIDMTPIESMVLIQRQELAKRQDVSGFVDDNSISATFHTGINVQYFTLIELLDHQQIFYERIKRSTGDIDVLKFPVKRVNLVLSKKGIQYYQTIDFILDPNGNIRWKTNCGPESGEIYSIHYEANIRYRASRALHVSRFAQIKNTDGTVGMVKLPEVWECTREMFVKRTDKDGMEILQNKVSTDSEEEEETED